jgi:hypothetical protein
VRERDQAYNEARYEALIGTYPPHYDMTRSNESLSHIPSALINDMAIQRMQQAPLNLVRAPVPSNVELDSNTPHAHIFMTKDALTTTDKLLVLVPGSQVDPGIWSRRIMCDENINDGSMLTTCYKAVKAGFEIIITNPNANYWSNNKAYVGSTTSSYFASIFC